MSETRGPRVYRPAATATWVYDHRWGTQIGDNTRLSVTRLGALGRAIDAARAERQGDDAGAPYRELQCREHAPSAYCSTSCGFWRTEADQ